MMYIFLHNDIHVVPSHSPKPLHQSDRRAFLAGHRGKQLLGLGTAAGAIESDHWSRGPASEQGLEYARHPTAAAHCCALRVPRARAQFRCVNVANC